MRIFKRIIYSLFVAIGMGYVIFASILSVFEKDAAKKIQEALDQGQYEVLISEKYYHRNILVDDIINIDQSTFKLKIYNVIHIKKVDDLYQYDEGFQIIIHHLSGPTLNPAIKGIIKTSNEDVKLTSNLLQYPKSPVYTFENVETESLYFRKAELYLDDVFYAPIGFELIKSKDEVVGSYPLSFELSDFELEHLLSTYYDENQMFPTEPTDTIGVTQASPRPNPMPIVIRNSIIYIVVVIASFYGFFIYKKKRLGRKAATEGLTKDIERLKSKSN
jgi:hypothetical protein